MPKILVKAVIKSKEDPYFEIDIPELVRPYEAPPETTAYALTVDGVGYKVPTEIVTEVDKTYTISMGSEFYHPEYGDIWHYGYLMRVFRFGEWITLFDVETWSRPEMFFYRSFTHTFLEEDEILEVTLRYDAVERPSLPVPIPWPLLLIGAIIVYHLLKKR